MKKTALLVVSSDVSLTGGIDQRLINQVLSEYRADQHDLVVIGAHGKTLLKVMGLKPVAVFNLPDVTKKIDVLPIIELVGKYRTRSFIMNHLFRYQLSELLIWSYFLPYKS